MVCSKAKTFWVFVFKHPKMLAAADRAKPNVTLIFTCH